MTSSDLAQANMNTAMVLGGTFTPRFAAPQPARCCRPSARSMRVVRAGAATAPAEQELGFKTMRAGIKEVSVRLPPCSRRQHRLACCLASFAAACMMPTVVLRFLSAPQAADESVLTPRFYTTDFDEMEQLFSLELNPNLPMEELEVRIWLALARPTRSGVMSAHAGLRRWSWSHLLVAAAVCSFSSYKDARQGALLVHVPLAMLTHAGMALERLQTGFHSSWPEHGRHWTRRRCCTSSSWITTRSTSSATRPLRRPQTASRCGLHTPPHHPVERCATGHSASTAVILLRYRSWIEPPLLSAGAGAQDLHRVPRALLHSRVLRLPAV